MTIQFNCIPSKTNTINMCNVITIFIMMILNYDELINTNQNNKIYDNYEIFIDKLLESNSNTVEIMNKKTKKITNHSYIILGNYEIETETWYWHETYHKFIKSHLDNIYNKHALYSSNVKKIVDSMLKSKVNIKYEHHYIIPYFMQIIISTCTLQRFDISDNSGSIYMLIANFGKDYGYEFNINYNDFISKMDIVNASYLLSLQTNDKTPRKLSRIITQNEYTITDNKSHEIQNGLEHGYNFTYDTKTSKFINSIKYNLSREKTKNKLNSELIKWFKLLIKQLEFYVDIKSGKDKLVYSYKVNSIKKSLDVIKNVNFKITSGKQIEKYKGIGSGTINRIDEILETGGLLEVNKADISGKHLEYVDELMQIFGIGRVKAYELYTEHGIKSISELKKAIKNKNIELPENIIKGIKYVDKIKTNIPRAEVEDIVKYLIITGIKYDPNINIRVCGSFRRESEISNDIDIIISHPDIITKKQTEDSNIMTNFIKQLIKSSFIVDSLTSLDVPTKYMGICRLSSKHMIRRIDIRFIPQESYYTAILYFTGSPEFNRKMRSVALSMGYTLNEYRLLNDKGKPFKITSEKDIFDYLNMEYLQPKYRK